MQAIEQTRTTRNVPLLRFFNDKVGSLHHGEMLTHCVVIQSHVLGEFRRSNMSVGVDNAAKDVIARGVADSPSLELNVVRVNETPREFTGAAFIILVYARINKFLTACFCVAAALYDAGPATSRRVRETRSGGEDATPSRVRRRRSRGVSETWPPTAPATWRRRR